MAQDASQSQQASSWIYCFSDNLFYPIKNVQTNFCPRPIKVTRSEDEIYTFHVCQSGCTVCLTLSKTTYKINDLHGINSIPFHVSYKFHVHYYYIVMLTKKLIRYFHHKVLKCPVSNYKPAIKIAIKHTESLK